MNGPNDILVDTNLIILGIGGNERVRELLEDHSLFISVITEIELLSIPFQRTQEERLMREFISNCFIVDLDSEIKIQTIQLRRGHKKKNTGCDYCSFIDSKKTPLFTADKGFSKIPALDIVVLNLN